MAKISVIIPVYNSASWIARSLRSILDQSLPREDYEVIVVNDGSTDNLLEVLRPYMDEIIFINREQNKGLPFSLNQGILKSKGRFIIRLDSDDYVHRDYLNIPYMYLTLNPEMDAVAVDYIKVDEKENVLSRHNCIEEPIGCAIMFRHEQLIAIGLYDENQKLHEEKELMSRFSKQHVLTRIPLPLYRYRDREASLSKNNILIKEFGKHYG